MPLVLIASDRSDAVRLATERLDQFDLRFDQTYQRVLRENSLPLSSRELEGDRKLAEDLLARLAANGVDYTLFFRRLCAAPLNPSGDSRIASLSETQ